MNSLAISTHHPHDSKKKPVLKREDYEKINRVMNHYKKERHDSYESKYNATKDTIANSFVGQFYFASLSIVGLFIVFRIIQSHK
jgi:hypothetical protein